MANQDATAAPGGGRRGARAPSGGTGPGRLLRHPSFAPLFVVQALGAFNDNVFKTAFVSLMTYVLVGNMEMSIEVLAPIASAVFIVPFAFLAPIAGQIADRVDKARMMKWVKFTELLLMLAASAAYMTQHVGFLFLLLFLMGAQSAFFSPIKYGVLPQYLKPTELVSGNGLIQAATFIAILGGSIAGANLVLTPRGAEIVSAVVVMIALIGWIASLYAGAAKPAPGMEPIRGSSLVDGSLHLRRLTGGPLSAKRIAGRSLIFVAIWAGLLLLLDVALAPGAPLGPLEAYRSWFAVGASGFMLLLYILWPSISDSLACARRERSVFNAIRAIAWFWFVGATYLTLLPVLASTQLQGDETVFTLLLAAFSVGIGLGSVLTSVLYRGEARVGFAPWGAIGIAIFSIDLAFAVDDPAIGAEACVRSFDPTTGALVSAVAEDCLSAFQFLETAAGWRVLADFILLATCAGVYLTPLNAVYQQESPPDARGRIVACSNMIDSFFMAVSSLAVAIALIVLSPQQTLALFGATGFFAAFAVARWAPETVLGKLSRKVWP